MKAWLIAGHAIGSEQRALHMRIDVRESDPLPDYSEEELDARAAAILAESRAANEEPIVGS